MLMTAALSSESDGPAGPSAADAPRRYLITGGLGYVGAWIATRLASRGHKVHVLSRKADKPRLGVPYELLQADLTEQHPEALTAILPEKLDAVIHAASFNESFVSDYGRKALLINVLGTRNLLEALAAQSRRLSRPAPLCLYLSTFHVYGQSAGEIDESLPALPRNDYALTHFLAEEYFRLFQRGRLIDSIIVRLSNGYGAPKTPDSDKWYLLLNDLCRQAARTGVVILGSSPEVKRDFVWLGDVAEVMEKLSQRRDLAGRLFNVASGKAVSIGEVARLVAATATERLGKEVGVEMRVRQGPAMLAPELRVDNLALREAIGMEFHDRMREEIVALLDIAAQGGRHA
jgi:UDP-glucose 4-epimerase